MIAHLSNPYNPECQVYVPRHLNSTLKKYSSCRSTLNKFDSQNLSFYPVVSGCPSPAKGKRNPISIPFFNKSLSDQLQICLSYREKLENI